MTIIVSDCRVPVTQPRQVGRRERSWNISAPVSVVLAGLSQASQSACVYFYILRSAAVRLSQLGLNTLEQLGSEQSMVIP